MGEIGNYKRRENIKGMKKLIEYLLCEDQTYLFMKIRYLMCEYNKEVSST
jgi:hypothetical protein